MNHVEINNHKKIYNDSLLKRVINSAWLDLGIYGRYEQHLSQVVKDERVGVH